MMRNNRECCLHSNGCRHGAAGVYFADTPGNFLGRFAKEMTIHTVNCSKQKTSGEVFMLVIGKMIDCKYGSQATANPRY